MSQQAGGQPAAGSIESLYPFLYAGKTDVSAVLAQVRESTVAKAAEILELRRAVLAADGARLTACAREMAAQFGAGGGAIAASPAVDHALVTSSADPRIVKEMQVTTYHVLWELVHVFFEQPGVLAPGVVA